MFFTEDFPLPHGPFSATTKLCRPFHADRRAAISSANRARPNKSCALHSISASAEKCVAFFTQGL